MPRAIILSAGLAAALITSPSGQPPADAADSAGQADWVEHHVQSVERGAVYRLDGCFTINEPGVLFVSLRIAWYEQPSGYGSTIFVDDLTGDPSAVGSQQCLSLTNADAPCAAVSARFGVMAKGNPSGVDAYDLQLTADESATPVSCPTPSATPPSPTPSPTPSVTPTPAPESPPPTVTQTPRPDEAPPDSANEGAQEPTVFGSLVNGGFESLRDDGTPYGWRKVGGEMGATTSFHAAGERSATLTSTTASTKWLYQTVTINGGGFYRLRAWGLNVDSGVRELMLRISWYASEDGSGSQISTADSETLATPSTEFVEMDTGPTQAPPDSRSAKVRLLVRPQSAAKAVAYFDDVTFGATSERPAPISTSGGVSSSTTAGGGSPTVTGHPPSVLYRAIGQSTGPSTLANVKPASERPLPATSGSGRPLWPVLLALGLPAAGIALLAADGLRRSRIDGADDRRL